MNKIGVAVISVIVLMLVTSHVPQANMKLKMKGY